MIDRLAHEDIRAREREMAEQIARLERLEMIGRLAGGVAHDFNNLLTVILGYGEVVNEGLADGDPAKRALGEILRAARRGADLTRQLLTLGRAERGTPGPVDVAAAARGLDKLLRRLIPEDVEITLEAASPAWVIADIAEIEQVLVNLAANARDAMPGGGALRISVTADPDHVALRVQDTGSGMSEKTLQRVFDPFFTTKPDGRGTGLGLATVQSVVARLGGTISLESELGRGTRVDIALPRCDAPGAPESADDTGRKWQGRGAVLIIEDDRTVRRLLEVTLQRAGYTVLLANGAREAEALVASPARIDLVMTDVVMPETSGVDLCRRIRERRGELPAVFMSAHTAHDALRDVRESGAPFLAKPFTPEEARRAVAEAMGA
jgi:CheY-like chemotaxis protein/anti-sigma regulatory factor (Ser/Thr protein kinase)